MTHPAPHLAQVTQIPSTLKQNSWNTPRDLNDGTGKVLSAIDRLFNRLDGIYMAKWKSNFPNQQAVANWTEAWSQGLCRNGITVQMAFDGVLKCESDFKWPPSLPEFLELCQVQIDYEAAFLEAVKQSYVRHNGGDDCWRQPAIYWAAQDFGPFELRNVSYKQAEAKWKRLLDKRMGSACEAVPGFVLQIAAPARDEAGTAISSTEAKEMARVAIAQMASKRPSREIAIERAKAVLALVDAGSPVSKLKASHAREVLARLDVGQGDAL